MTSVKVKSTTGPPIPTQSQSQSPLAQIKQLENDPELISLCQKYLPSNYDFEIAKTVWRIRKIPACKIVALQMPEGKFKSNNSVMSLRTRATMTLTLTCFRAVDIRFKNCPSLILFYWSGHHPYGRRDLWSLLCG